MSHYSEKWDEEMIIIFSMNPLIFKKHILILGRSIKADWTRFTSTEYQQKIDKIIKETLDDLKIPYIKLTGTVEQRLKQYNTIINYFNHND